MSMTPELLGRLVAQRTIDLTTYGRQSSLPRRIEIWWFHIEGRFIITGTPGRRDWLANVRANPEVIVHAAGHDLPGTAVEVTDPDFRRRVCGARLTRWYSSQAEMDSLVGSAPMIEVQL
jgi:deazaflavin-dependent oxidoreductase (nitroreductase family)